MIGDGERITVLAIGKQELAFVIGTPELIGSLAQRQGGALRTTTPAAALLDQTVAIQHGMDGAFGGKGNLGESTEQAPACAQNRAA